MKWAVVGLVSLSAWLGASVACGANFVNSTDARAAPPKHSPASLEEPPPDDKPRTYTSSSPSLGTPRSSSDSFSLLFSPLYLLLPMFKMSGELRPVSHAGLALFGGFGQTSIDFANSDGSKGTLDADTYLLGTQLIGYPMRPFDGLLLGAQLQYVHVDVNGQVAETSVGGVGSGLGIGPFVGYKWIARVGLTWVVQAGFQYLAVRAEAHDQAGNSASASDDRFAPLLNLDLGWTF